jgi:hypothetical protein
MNRGKMIEQAKGYRLLHDHAKKIFKKTTFDVRQRQARLGQVRAPLRRSGQTGGLVMVFR